MCGIAGCIGKADREQVAAMLASLAHRGPDGRGVWADERGGAALGHARLAIIDLSSAGAQPMSYAGGRFWTVFNGEIYNYLELRGELEAKGHRFASRSDTEVLLASYAEWGTGCLRRLRGMFAFALIDREPEAGAPEAVLARDRLGIKPLLILERDGVIWFASVLAAFLSTGMVERKLDPQATAQYLAFGAALQPRTILRGVRSLEPGCLVEVRAGRARQRRYWDLHAETQALREELKGVTEPEASKRLRALLEDATSCHLIADVPVGAFLSGGIDSTLVVSLMSRLVNRPIETFSVGFEAEHAETDERPFARLAAERAGACHTEVTITAEDAASSFGNFVRAIDQPSTDGFNTWLVSRAARRSVTVALSGLGGDELFAGYPHFGWYLEAFEKGPATREDALAWEIVHRWIGGRLAFQRLLESTPRAERMALLRRLMRDGEWRAAVASDSVAGCIRKAWLPQFHSLERADADPVQQVTYAETSTYLVSTLLRDADVASMAHGLEVRPVLLDHRLVEYAYALPGSLKWRSPEGKRVLVDSARDLIPEAIAARAKTGFSLPVLNWMATTLKPRMLALLEGRRARALFSGPYLAETRRLLLAGRPPYALWAWAVLLAWMEEANVEVA